MTCLPWTIYLWKGLYLIGCPLLLRTNYRCIPSLNFSVDDAKCVENVHKFTMYTHFLSVLILIEQAKFQHTRMSSYAKNKLQMCSVTQHQCRRHLICGKCSHINSLHSLLDCHKNVLSSLNNLFMATFELTRMSSYDTNKLQMCSVSQHHCRRRQMCGNVRKSTRYTHFLSVLVLIEQSKLSTH